MSYIRLLEDNKVISEFEGPDHFDAITLHGQDVQWVALNWDDVQDSTECPAYGSIDISAFYCALCSSNEHSTQTHHQIALNDIQEMNTKG